MKKTEFYVTDLQWKHTYLAPQVKTGFFSGRKKRKQEQADLSGNEMLLCSRPGEGKISNAGYDQMYCLFTELPFAYNRTFCARIRVLQFGSDDRMTGQEGFGIFLRDTMKPDARTGYDYSNTVIAGGVMRSWNVMLRSGIGKYSINNCRQDVLRKDSSFDKQDLQKDYEITLRMKRRSVSVRILDESGKSVFLKQEGADDEGFCTFPYDARELRKRQPLKLYFGFFTARGAAIKVHSDTIRITQQL